MIEKENLEEIERAAEWFKNRAKATLMPGACRMFELAEKALREKANGVTVQEWISVKDRLPEEEGLYLVAVVNDHERRYSKTAWYHVNGNWFLHQKVTHWQYLPQPLKGE